MEIVVQDNDDGKVIAIHVIKDCSIALNKTLFILDTNNIDWTYESHEWGSIEVRK